MLIKASTILPITSAPLTQGMVCVEGGRVRAIGPEVEIRAQFAGHETMDLGQCILLPGLINAHCHLDYMMMKGSIIPCDSFSAWIRQINGLKRMLSKEDYLLAVHEGYDELLARGTTTVVNVTSFPEIFPHLTPPPLRVIWALELIDIRTRQAHDDYVNGMMMAVNYPDDWLGEVAFSPHAPYTASLGLYRLAREAARATGKLLTTHVAESDEEYDMFTLGKGKLADFLRGIGRDMGDCTGESPFSHLLKNGAIGAGDLLVHMNYLTDEDIDEVGRHGMSVCYCPKSHHYFGHAPFPLQKLRDNGARVVLGTDSLASNNSLDMFSEMRAVRERFPSLCGSELLSMSTIESARSIGHGDDLGQIAPGARADLIAIPDEGGDRDIHERVLSFRGDVPFVMINGNVVRHG
ncbi:amidohydrolase family protein [Kamptonema cortianum]|nr:amidohydrolase family protein [Kamptonema cortianum]MDL5046206.1 amidohydrolase family protein [Oscillatoria amoena NRMC-F 0135]